MTTNDTDDIERLLFEANLADTSAQWYLEGFDHHRAISVKARARIALALAELKAEES